MSHRLPFLLGSMCWSALVTAVLIAVPLASPVPDPMATHWGLSGMPNGALPPAGLLLINLPIWAVITAVAVLRGWTAKRPAERGFAAALLGAGGAFFGGLTASTALANLDRGDWHQAQLPFWHIPAVLGAAALAGVLAYWLGNRGPDEGGEVGKGTKLVLPPGAPQSWTSSAVSRTMAALAGVLALTGVVFAVLAAWWPGWIPLVSVVAPLLAALALVEFSVARIDVDERGVRTAFGPLQWPVRRIRLERVEFADVGRYRAIEVGGWGYRLTPRATAIMLRGGDCLVLRLNSGRDFVISVDGPERGAQVVNTLLAGPERDQ